MKNNSILLKTRDLPNEKIKDLGLSFRNIAKKCHNLTKLHTVDYDPLTPFEQLNREKKLRRDLSNWVNDPKNLVDCKGKYIGDKYGARITICRNDGLVTHDVETFCRDVRNKNNRILGSNNNFVYLKDDFVESNKANKRFLYSTINVVNVENSDIKYSSVNAYKVKSSSIPSSNPNSILMQYSPNERADGDNVTIVSGEIMDDHTTRKEIMQAASGRYGYAARVSRSDGINYYVCKYVEDDNGMSLFYRLSYFKFPDPTVIDVAAADGRFTTLVTAVKAAGLVQTLSSPGPFTVFAPTDAAFSKLPAGTVQALLADVPKLTNILKYHVVAGKVMAADVVKLNFATTVAGLSVSVRVENGKVYINESQVTITNIVGSNGVIHVIDTVLLPPTTVDLLDKSKKFNTLVTAVKAAGLVQTLSSPGPFTVFAPTDAAFSKLPTGTVQALLADVPKLTNILKYHVVAGKVIAADVIKLNFATTVTVDGLSVSVRVENGKVYINDSQVTITDIVCSNGVIHVIDTVLLPQTIVDLLYKSKIFNTLVGALKAADLEETLYGTDNFTLFAPTDSAFNKVSDDDPLIQITQNTEQLAKLLKYHTIFNRHIETDVLNKEYLMTLAGLSISAWNDELQMLKINDSKVIISNIVGTNGVVHAIDEVLRPLKIRDVISLKFKNIDTVLDVLADKAKINGEALTSQINEYLDRLTGALKLDNTEDPSDITFIALKDAAFLPGQLALFESLSAAKLLKFVRDLTCNQEFTQEDLVALAEDDGTATALSGETWDIDTMPELDTVALTVNGAKIRTKEIVCTNGIMYASSDALFDAEGYF